MEKLFSSSKVYVSQSVIPGARRGVFAKDNIKEGVVIEVCPIIDVSEDEVGSLNDSVLTSYFFYYGEKLNRLLVALGFGSIYNHSNRPNATFEIKQLEGVMDFIAIADIGRDEEITIDYKHGLKDQTPLWFE